MTDLDDITAEDLRRYLRAEWWDEVAPDPPQHPYPQWRAPSGTLWGTIGGVPRVDFIAVEEGRPLSAVAADVRRLRDEAQAATVDAEHYLSSFAPHPKGVGVMACPQCHTEHPRDQACLPCWASIAMRDREINHLRAKAERLREERDVMRATRDRALVQVSEQRRRAMEAEAEVERLRSALVEVRDEARAMLLTIASTPGLPAHLTQHAAAGLRDAVDALDALEAER